MCRLRSRLVAGCGAVVTDNCSSRLMQGLCLPVQPLVSLQKCSLVTRSDRPPPELQKFLSEFSDKDKDKRPAGLGQARYLVTKLQTVSGIFSERKNCNIFIFLLMDQLNKRRKVCTAYYIDMQDIDLFRLFMNITIRRAVMTSSLVKTAQFICLQLQALQCRGHSLRIKLQDHRFSLLLLALDSNSLQVTRTISTLNLYPQTGSSCPDQLQINFSKYKYIFIQAFYQEKIYTACSRAEQRNPAL